MGGHFRVDDVRPLLGNHLRAFATETGGAVIVMSIIGGAVVPVIQGLVSDMLGSMQLAFSVSLVCFVVVLLYFWNEHRLETAESR